VNLKQHSQEFQSAIYFSNCSRNREAILSNMKMDKSSQLFVYSQLEFLDCQCLWSKHYWSAFVPR